MEKMSQLEPIVMQGLCRKFAPKIGLFRQMPFIVI